MSIFRRSQPREAVHSALREASGLWKKAARSGAEGLSDAGDLADDAWSQAKTHALDAWQDAKVLAERRFHETLNKAERSFRKSGSNRWDRVARKPATALIVIGVAVGLAALLASLRRPDQDVY